MRDFTPIYKPTPIIGFKCMATGGADVEVKYDEFFDQIVICLDHKYTASWSKEHLDEFILKLQEVSANYQKGGK